MTLCAAAIAETGKYIVTVSDVRYSVGYSGGEVGLAKGKSLHKRWLAYFAGADIGQAMPILETSAERLRDIEPTKDQVETTMVSVMRERLLRKCEAMVLAPYGIGMAEFLASGQSQFSSEAYVDMRYRIEQVDLGCEFLVCGYDPGPNPYPHILHVHGRGVVDDYTPTGFWAIGSGGYGAVSALFAQDYNFNAPLNVATYQMCAAKFSSERADLGHHTYLMVLEDDGRLWSLNTEKVRPIWARHGRPRLPRRLIGMPPFRLMVGKKQTRRRPIDQTRRPKSSSKDQT